MYRFRWIDPDYRTRLAAQGLDRLDALLECQAGELVSGGHRNRDVTRVELPREDGTAERLYVKREQAAQGKYVLKHVAGGRGPWGKPRLEFEVLRRVRDAGVECPRPVACLQDGPWPVRGALMLADLGDLPPLNDYLGSGRLDGPGRREAFFARLGREVGRLHEAGINQPDLFANHIFVGEAADQWRIVLIDFQRSLCHRSLPTARRVRDLAALLATVPSRLACQRDRERLLDAYLSCCRLGHQAGRIREGIGERCRRLLTRRKIWEIRESDTREHRAVQSLESLEIGTMWVDPDFRPSLERAGLTSFTSVMQSTSGTLLRALADRENWRLELEAGHGAYLKKHHIRTFSSRFRARVGAGPGDSAARVEAENVARLGRGGIAAMRLIAYGEKLHEDGCLESFLLTEELAGYQQLDDFLRERFPPRDTDRPTRRDPGLVQLIQDVADVAGKLHRLGYNHRDLYCCHFFIKEQPSGRFQVNLIDLQRVQHRRRRRLRWMVKDLAQLSYSAPRERISRTQKLAFLKRYLGVRKLRPEDKRFIRRILAKQRFMERKRGLHP